MTVHQAPFDPGLQPERTLLAWRRTFLSLAVASAVVVRFAAEVVGPAVALVLGMTGVALAIVGYIRAATRYRRAHEGLTNSGQLPLDGSALGLMTLTLLLVAAGAAAFVIGTGAQRLIG